jgi:ABC-type arginine/histidine transport system permease subunit
VLPQCKTVRKFILRVQFQIGLPEWRNPIILLLKAGTDPVGASCLKSELLP